MVEAVPYFGIKNHSLGYPHNILLISPRKRGASNVYPHDMFSWKSKKKLSTLQLKKVSYLELCRMQLFTLETDSLFHKFK